MHRRVIAGADKRVLYTVGATSFARLRFQQRQSHTWPSTSSSCSLLSHPLQPLSSRLFQVASSTMMVRLFFSGTFSQVFGYCFQVVLETDGVRSLSCICLVGLIDVTCFFYHQRPCESEREPPNLDVRRGYLASVSNREELPVVTKSSWCRCPWLIPGERPVTTSKR